MNPRIWLTTVTTTYLGTFVFVSEIFIYLFRTTPTSNIYDTNKCVLYTNILSKNIHMTCNIKDI